MRLCYRVTLVAVAQLVEQLARIAETHGSIPRRSRFGMRLDSLRWSSGRIMRFVLPYHPKKKSKSNKNPKSKRPQSSRVYLLLCDLGLGKRSHSITLEALWLWVVVLRPTCSIKYVHHVPQ